MWILSLVFMLTVIFAIKKPRKESFSILLSLLLLFAISTATITPTTVLGQEKEESNKSMDKVVFRSLNTDGIATVTLDNKDVKVRLATIILPESAKLPELKKVNDDTVKVVNDSLKDKELYLELVEKYDNKNNQLAFLWIDEPKEKVTKEFFKEYCVNGVLVSGGVVLSGFKDDDKYSDLLNDLSKEAKDNKLPVYEALTKDEINELKDDYFKSIDSKKTTDNNNKTTTTKTLKIKGNVDSKIYHVPGGQFYNKLDGDNIIYFDSEEEAKAAGYRKSKR